MEWNRNHTISAVLLAGTLLMAGCGSSAPVKTAEKKAAIGKWGFDLEAMDTSVKPGDDFNLYANGAWLKKTQIPADQVIWGTMQILEVKAENDVKALIEELAAKQNPAGSTEQFIGDYYSSYVDTKTINELGLKPFEADLAEIQALPTHEAVASLIGRPGFAGNTPIGVVPELDAKNPDRYLPLVVQAGIGLPNRDYYLSKDAKFQEIRAKYKAYIEQMLTLAKTPAAAASAAAILDLETKIAERQWPLERQRNRDLTYNLKTKKELLASIP